ncbi:macro domain-containing protein [Agromyces seonyuensis]|uniref:Macro domain-containing protein n=1 Tax=Agromyces seonyuensis TaxID=2662446 RepID=A0A6I4P369_9MICO|nr:hypothetical protein [Agromyces seonyuensis]
MSIVTALQGDLTVQAVDAVVNAASPAMRGGGGVDGAIHRAGGPSILAECIERFPHGLPVGEAGWTGAGDLPARWVVHAVGPNRHVGETDPAVLVSAFRRSLEVAALLGAESVAVPLIGAGVYGWSVRDSANAAVAALSGMPGQFEEVRIVHPDADVVRTVEGALRMGTTVRLLEGVRELHRRGFQGVRVRCGLAPSGLFWRFHVLTPEGGDLGWSSGAEHDYFGLHVDPSTPSGAVADRMLELLPPIEPSRDPVYAGWLSGLIAVAVAEHAAPFSFADFPLEHPGYSVGAAAYPYEPDPPAPSA